MSDLIIIDIDEDSGEAEVKFSDAFISDDPLFRADILRDVIFDCLYEYNKSMVEMGWKEKSLIESDVLHKLNEMLEVIHE